MFHNLGKSSRSTLIRASAILQSYIWKYDILTIWQFRNLTIHNVPVWKSENLTFWKSKNLTIWLRGSASGLIHASTPASALCWSFSVLVGQPVSSYSGCSVLGNINIALYIYWTVTSNDNDPRQLTVLNINFAIWAKTQNYITIFVHVSHFIDFNEVFLFPLASLYLWDSVIHDY